MHYEIQRINPAKSGNQFHWSRAWGYHRSIIHAKTDAAAIAQFRRETAKSSGPMRLIRWHPNMGQYTLVVDNGLTPPNPFIPRAKIALISEPQRSSVASTANGLY